MARAGDLARALAGAALCSDARLRADVTGLALDLEAAKVGDPAQERGPPTRPHPDEAAPVLSVDGFEGPLDWLLEMARAQRVNLTKLSILALVEAFTAALDAALAVQGPSRVDLSRWGEWLVMAATLTQLRSRLLQ